LESDPENAPIDKSFVISGGTEVITFEFLGAQSPKRQINNQADIFYYSGHGSASGSLSAGFSVEPSDVEWDKEMQVAIFSGCSVLDINDYNGNGVFIPAPGTPYPGEKWNNVGPQYLLGYNHLAPSDEQNSDSIVANYGANRVANGDIQAWMDANDNSNGRNACAIDRDIAYHYFHKTVIVPGLINTYELTTIPFADW